MKCMHCGGEVLVQPESGLGICTRCMAELPLPEKTEAQEQYDRAGELLRESRFDEAADLYQELLIENPNDAAVCWGLALSEYGIEYVTDPATGEQLPTLHRLSLQQFSESLYVKKAVGLSLNSLSHEFYQTQSRLIDSIQSRSLSVSVKETPVDVFICYKRSEEGEKRTADSRMAADYYRELTRRGYQVFFAEETLKAGEEYEPRIFAALRSAKVMLAFATKQEYYEAVWVKNEWSRYAALMRREQMETGGTKRLLIPVYQHMDHSALPKILREMPSYVEMDTSENPKSELLNLVASHFEKGKTEDVSSILREVRSDLSGGRSAMDGRLEKDSGESAEKTRVLASIRLAGGEFEEAGRLFQAALKQPGGQKDPENYLGLMMCRLQIAGKEALSRYAGLIDADRDFRKALNCASPEEKKKLQNIAENCRENLNWQKNTEEKRAECRRQLKEVLDSPKELIETQQELLQKCTEYRESQEAAMQKLKLSDLNLLIFLALGNCLPFLCQAFAYAVGSENDSFGSIFMVLQVIVYYVCLWRLMNEKRILDTGCITIVIRLFLIGLIYSFTLGLTMGNLRGWLLPAAILLTLVTAVYGYRKLSDPMRIRRKASEGRAWAAARRRELPELAGKLLAGLEERLEMTAQPYRNYYTDYESEMEQWKEKAKRLVSGRIEELEGELAACERGIQ